MLSVCLYCDSQIRILQENHERVAAVETTPAAPDMREFKPLQLAGRRDDALRLYQEKMNTGALEAAQIVDSLTRELSLDIVRHQQLSPFGMLIFGLSGIAVCTALIAGFLQQATWLLVAVIVFFGSVQIWFALPAFLTTLKFVRGMVAPAQVLKIAPIGKTKLGGKNIHAFKLLLRVEPPQETPFEAEMLLPVQEKNLSRMQTGTTLRVKYLRNPLRVIYQN